MPSCGEWTGRKSNAIEEAHDKSWLYGALSTIAMIKKVDILAHTDAESIDLWMDNYCQAHPLDSLLEGAADLSFELSRRMHGK